jgi:phenylacetate-CoA ligase
MPTLGIAPSLRATDTRSVRPGSNLDTVLSATEGIEWPALPATPATQLLAQLYQLGRTERWPEQKLRAHQLQQFALLAQHAAEQSPFYGARFADVGFSPRGPWSDEDFRRLPLLTRGELLTRADSIHSSNVPKSHGNVGTAQTSGSTGQLVSVRRTGVNELTWLALVMRDHLWHRRDFTQTLAVIRARVPANDDDALARKSGWGPPATLLHRTGPCFSLPLTRDVDFQAAWLLRRSPGYLITYPTNLAALLSRFEQIGQTPGNLLEVRTVGETLPPDLRARCDSVLSAPLVDSYSSEEVGAIALMCPESGLYHVQAESVLVEVLDDAGEPCAPGQVGRVVVTDLHNFATPLIRYEIGDHAQVGPACSCGRGLPTLTRILGRTRNMVRLPTGERHWPLVGGNPYQEVGGILQYQLVQHSLTDIEMRLVTVGGRLGAAKEATLVRIVQRTLGHAFPIRFSYFEGELPQTRSGKFEEFVCVVAPDVPLNSPERR